jgi:hypothetical protein
MVARSIMQRRFVGSSAVGIVSAAFTSALLALLVVGVFLGSVLVHAGLVCPAGCGFMNCVYCTELFFCFSVNDTL